MTDEQINIKIAELCGWKPQTLCTDYDGNPWPDSPPNYTSDLNACHAAETAKEMHFDQRWIETIVEVALREACHNIERTDGWDWVALVARLSVRQRCEAFLRVHGQWEEEA